MGDGKQGNASILGRLEDLAFHVDAHSAGALIQEGVLGPWRWANALGCGPSFAEALACATPPPPWEPRSPY